MKPPKPKLIEEYDSGNWMLFMASDNGDFVSLIISAYNEKMLMLAFWEDVFGGGGVTYTLVER